MRGCPLSSARMALLSIFLFFPSLPLLLLPSIIASTDLPVAALQSSFRPEELLITNPTAPGDDATTNRWACASVAAVHPPFDLTRPSPTSVVAHDWRGSLCQHMLLTCRSRSILKANATSCRFAYTADERRRH